MWDSIPPCADHLFLINFTVLNDILLIKSVKSEMREAVSLAEYSIQLTNGSWSVIIITLLLLDIWFKNKLKTINHSHNQLSMTLFNYSLLSFLSWSCLQTHIPGSLPSHAVYGLFVSKPQGNSHRRVKYWSFWPVHRRERKKGGEK